MSEQKIILIDFDGVLHSYASGWEGVDVIPDPPVPGAIGFLSALVKDRRFEACVYSSRSRHAEGIAAMKGWLVGHGFPKDSLRLLRFPVQKPAAFLTIDDRCVRFEGYFPSLDWIDNFKPWNKKGT